MPDLQRDNQNRLSQPHHPAMAERRDPLRDPRTRREWQAAVDDARARILLSAWRDRGLVELPSGFDGDLTRALEVISKGAARGIQNRTAGVRQAIMRYLRQEGETRGDFKEDENVDFDATG